MIQRIQSLYLLIASLLTGSLFFTEFARFLDDEGFIYVLKYRGLFNIGVEEHEMKCVFTCIIIASLLIITTISLLTTILVYKKRMIQLLLCRINIGLLICLLGMILYRCFDAKNTLDAQLSFSWVLIFPVISVVLVILAMGGIRKDEALIRSLDRIR